MSAQATAELHEAEPHEAIAYPPMLNVTLYGLMMVLCVVTWNYGLWPLTVLMWFPMAHFGHAVLLAFHEAVHFTLAKNRLFNEFRGFMIGATVGVPLSVYRQVHLYHHANLSSPTDIELWPYNDPQYSLWFRRFCAFMEISLAFFWTPLVFFRGVLVDRKMKRSTAWRIVGEYILVVAIWATALTIIHVYGWWPQFLVGYLIPAMGAALMQTLRKFTEHMGLVGRTPLTLSRTVVDPTPLGRLIAASMLNVCYHGTHHRFGKLGYPELPPATDRAYKTEPDPVPIYRTYWSAFWAMVPTLRDPKCGPFWMDGGPKAKASGKNRSEAVVDEAAVSG
jgi:fatty acid desaturase